MKDLVCSACPDLAATEADAVCEVLALAPEGILSDLRANGEKLRNLIALIRTFIESGQLKELIEFAKLIFGLFSVLNPPAPVPTPLPTT
jgi:predicted RNA-binding protein